MSDGLSELGQAAVWYCEHGFAVVPLKPKSKQPAMAHGLNDWFDNPDSAREVWTRYPDFNIGIVCGAPSHGLLVLDFDVDEEREKDGYATLSAWERAQGELPETAVAITGSGGMHYLYRTNRNTIRPSANAELGVDVRCDGSYIVAPPSVHPNGNRYEWQDHPEDVDIATANGAVYDFLDHVQRNGGVDETRKDNGKFKLPDEIRHGERDKTLFRYAAHLRAIGRSDEEIMNAVVGVNFTRCDPPMDSKDVQRIVKSACKYERGSDGDEALSVGRPGAQTGGGRVIPFRTDKGKLLTNILGQNIIARNHARYIDGALAVWNGKRWVFSKRAIEWMCLSYADDAKSADRSEVVKYIEVMAPSVLSASMSHGHYVQFLNCTYDVDNQCEVTPTPDMYITATLPVELDLDAPYGLADQFIASVADNDEPTMRAMCEVIGACMCSKRVLSQSPMLIGRPTGGTSTAANGKSTYIDMIRALLGDENVASMDIASLGDKYGPAELTGKLANLGDDIPDEFLKGTELALFKKLVTGNKIKAERKYHDPFDFKPSATMVFSMNAMPRLADTTDGVFRRLAFVPFRRTFTPDQPDFDPDMGEKLAATETLQRFAVLGLMALHDMLADGRDRLTEIPDMVAEVEEIRIDNSVVRRWMYDEEITATGVDREPIQSVYDRFTRWCEEAGEKYTLKRTSFTKELMATLGNVSISVLYNQSSGKKVRTFVSTRGGNASQ
jgi:P4 family phage/plasmid primase-like protien